MAADALPTMPPADPPVDVAAAGRRRLDVLAADAQAGLADQALGLTKAGILTQVSLGVDLERETDKQTVVGPSIGLDVPIFNQHQGQIARAEAELRLARGRAAAARVNVEADVRAAEAELQASRAAAELATGTLVPQRAAVTHGHSAPVQRHAGRPLPAAGGQAGRAGRPAVGRDGDRAVLDGPGRPGPGRRAVIVRPALTYYCLARAEELLATDGAQMHTDQVRCLPLICVHLCPICG